MKNGEIMEVYEAISEILRDKSLVLPVGVGFAFAKTKKALRDEAITIDDERSKIIYRYGTLKDGEWYVDKDKIDDCNREIGELMEIENDVKVWPVPIDVIEGIEMRADLIDKIMPLIFMPARTGEPILDGE